MSAGIILFAAFAVCLIVGVPVSISLGVASLCSVVFGGLSASSTVIAQRIFGGLQSTSIMAIAFFVLAGNLMTKGGISRRIVNFANCDMVGHTGVFDAAVKAVETVDTCVGRLEDAVLKMGGAILLTADHGNADKMYEPDGSAFTAHTTNPVPFALIGCGDVKLRNDGRLCDLSPTILKIMDLPQPKEMTGKSLIID